MTKKRVFGELELAILKMFKDEERLTVRDVLTTLKAGDKYTTVMTVMNRLVEKKQLLRARAGQQYEYWLNASRDSSPSLLEKLKETLFGGKSTSMVSYLLESSHDITDKELAEMESLIKQMRKSRKDL